MLPRPIEHDEPLGAENEAQWDRLRSQIELAEDAFWLGFLFSPSPRSVIVLRERVDWLLRGQTRSLLLIKPETPDELRQVLRKLVDDEAPTRADCTWVEAVRSDSPGAKEHPWTDAWDELFLRANVRRDVLRERLHGGLVFAAAPEMKVRIREAAPDLWHVRSLVIDLGAVRPAVEAVEIEAAALPKVEATAHGSAIDPTFALAEAERREARGAPWPQAVALTRAAEGLVAEGKPREARDAALRAYSLLRGTQGELEATTLAMLAAAEAADGDPAAAADHIDHAIGLYRRIDHENVPFDFYVMAGQLALDRDDLGAAQRYYREAEAAARARLAKGRDAQGSRDLATALRQSAHTQAESGFLSDAIKALEEAVALYRELSRRGDEGPTFDRDLMIALVWLSAARRASGDLAGGIATAEEAVALCRQRILNGANSEARNDLAGALDGLSLAKLESGDLPGASTAIREALTILHEADEAWSGEDLYALGNLARILDNAGNIAWASGDASLAARFLDESLALRRRVHALTGDTPQTLHGLLVTLGLLGSIKYSEQDFAAAAPLQQASLAIARRLFTLAGATPRSRNAFRLILHDVAATHRAQGDENAARAAEEEAASLERLTPAAGAAPAGRGS